MKPRADSAVNRWQRRLKPVSSREHATAAGEHVVRRPAERPRTVAEAADELGLSIYTVRSWIASRRLAHLRLGRAIRVPAEELRRVIEASTVPAERE
jgi:excisionase family DNA binding protein